MSDQPRDARRGILYALGAFTSWGVVAPVHFKLLAAVPAPQILAQRIVWGCAFALALILALGQGRALTLALVPGRRLALLALSASLVAVNWLIYIWAINAGHIVQTSLGYFINPLVTVLLGILFLGERLGSLQIAACVLAGMGVLVMTAAAGVLPWIAVTLAVSFGFYGLIRKTVRVDPLIGFCTETLVLLPVALGYVLYLGATGRSAFLAGSHAVDVLLALTGVTTAAPLIWFAAAAQRLRLSTIGLLQYLSPTLLLGLGVLVYGEVFTRAHGLAFAAIWLGLALYTYDALRPAPQPAPRPVRGAERR